MIKYPTNSHIDGLLDLACRDGVDIRPTLLRVLTDLYVQKPAHSADEEVQYVELALGLIDTVDGPTRAAVATSLANYPAAPIAILARLSTAASTSDPAAIEPQTETGNLVELFFAADSEERRLILLNLDATSIASTNLAAPVSGEIIKRLENAALQRNTGEFSRTIERALGIGRGLAERITRDPSGEPIVVAAKTLGMKASVLQRILLFLNPAIGQSVQRVFVLAQLYDELSREAAEHMLAIWRKAAAPSPPTHQTIYDAEQSRNARSMANPTPHRATRDSGQQPDPLKSTR